MNSPAGRKNPPMTNIISSGKVTYGCQFRTPLIFLHPTAPGFTLQSSKPDAKVCPQDYSRAYMRRFALPATAWQWRRVRENHQGIRRGVVDRPFANLMATTARARLSDRG